MFFHLVHSFRGHFRLKIDFSMVQPLVLATKTTIRERIDYAGEHFQSLHILEKLSAEVHVTIPSKALHRRHVWKNGEHSFNISSTGSLM